MSTSATSVEKQVDKKQQDDKTASGTSTGNKRCIELLNSPNSTIDFSFKHYLFIENCILYFQSNLKHKARKSVPKKQIFPVRALAIRMMSKDRKFCKLVMFQLFMQALLFNYMKSISTKI